MLKVAFTITHPFFEFDQIKDNIPSLMQNSDYAERMLENERNQILLARYTRNENGQYVHYTFWKDRESNELWTQSIHDSPSTFQFYKNLTDAGYQYSIVKEEVDNLF